MTESDIAFYPLHGRPILVRPRADAVDIIFDSVVMTFMHGQARKLADAIAAFAEAAGEAAAQPEPVITALQILERVAAVIESAEVGETVETVRTRLAVLGELAHLASVAMGRAPIVPKDAP